MASTLRSRLLVRLVASLACTFGVAANAAPPAFPPGTVLPNAADAKPASENSRAGVAVVGLGRKAQRNSDAQVPGNAVAERDKNGMSRAMPVIPPPKN